VKVVTSRRRSVRTHPVSALSPSRAKDYLQCPRLFFYKTILGLKTPPSEATLRGTLAHFAFERIFDHPPEDRNVSLALEYIDAAWDAVIDPLRPRDSVPAASASARLRDAEDRYRECHEPGSASETRLLEEASSARALVPDERREDFLESVRTAVRGWFAMENPTKFTPTERELYVRARIGVATIHGYVDRFDSVPARDGAQRNYVSDYKGLSLETPLPTPTGWTTMGRVSVGDFLLGTSGEPVKVTDKTPEQRLDCYELLFEDGTTIVADTVHLWETLAPVPGIHSTAELAAMLATAPQTGVLLPGLRPPRLPEKELVLSPVEAGRLVGLRELLSPLSEEFRTLAAVARSSHVHRLEFLRGLLQVSISPGRVEVRDEVVAAIVSEIVVLSGLRPRPWSRTDGVMHMEFTREELAARVLDRDTAVPRRVVAIRPVTSVTTCCISVDAEDSLYCAGRGMVPTHNTGKKPSERFQDEAFFQLEVYALALAESGNVETHQLRLVYTNEADPKGVLVRQVTPQLLARTREKIRAVWDGIGRADRAWHEANLRGDDAAMEKAWEGKKQRLCDWCHFGPKHTNVCSTWNPSVAGMLPEEQELRISARPGNRIASGEATSSAADA
jgi:RecB family exonuclease